MWTKAVFELHLPYIVLAAALREPTGLEGVLQRTCCHKCVLTGHATPAWLQAHRGGVRLPDVPEGDPRLPAQPSRQGAALRLQPHHLPQHLVHAGGWVGVWRHACLASCLPGIIVCLASCLPGIMPAWHHACLASLSAWHHCLYDITACLASSPVWFEVWPRVKRGNCENIALWGLWRGS
jgi:hypothetical protein